MERIIIGLIGEEIRVHPDAFRVCPGVRDVLPVSKPFKLVNRELQAADTIVRVGPVAFGAPGTWPVIGGPCSVEGRDMMVALAHQLRDAGAAMLRGGAFKPRTSPYAFQGLGEEGLQFLAAAREATGLPFVTEVLDARDVPLVARHADMLQIGARNMQNFSLLKAVGRVDRPVLLKRGLSATIDEWLMAAEYIAAEGNRQIVLCERGVRGFDQRYTRNLLDLAAVPVVRQLSHLPVIVDPSHGSGRRDLVPPLALAALAVGSHGLMVEVHPRPEQAWSDGAQSLTPAGFTAMMTQVQTLQAALPQTAPALVTG